MKKMIVGIISLFFVLNMILPLSIVCAENNTEYECIRLPIISDQLKENVTEDITLYKKSDILYIPLHIVCPLLNAYWNVQDGGFIVDRDCISFRYYDENNMKLIIDFERGDEKWNKTDNILLEGNLLSCKKFGVEWCVDFIKFCDMFGVKFYQVSKSNIQDVKDKIKKISEDTNTTSWNDMDIEKELDFEENPYYIFVYSGTPLSSLYDKLMHNQDLYLWDYSCYEKLNLTDKEDNWFENILQSIKYSNTKTGLKIQSENVISNVINDDWGITKIILSPPYRSSEHYRKSLLNISGVNYSSYLNKNDLKTENNSKAEELEELLNNATITSSLATTADNILTKYLSDTEMFGKLNKTLDVINILGTPYKTFCEVNEFHKKLDNINENKINLLKKSIVENNFINEKAKVQRIGNEALEGIQIKIPTPEGTQIKIPIPTASPTKTPMVNILLNSIDNYEGLMDSANALCALYRNSNHQFIDTLYKTVESGSYAMGDTYISSILSESGDPSLALVSAILTVYDGFTAWTKNTYGEQLQKSENLAQSYFLEKVMKENLDIKNPENLYNRLTLMLQSSLCCFEYDEEYFQSNRNSIAKMLYTLDIDTSLNINYYHDPRNNNVDESIKNAILNFPVENVEQNIIAEGICGDNLTWTLDNKGQLIIKGTGEMYDYADVGSPFYKYKQDIKNVTISDDVTYIGENAFAYCENLENINLPDGLTIISYGCFKGCKSLKKISIPESVTKLGLSVFNNCEQLTNIKLPDNLKEIDSFAFNGCTNLIDIAIPESVEVLGSGAFTKCSKLKSITIHNNIKNISSDTFAYCTSLTSITISKDVEIGGKNVFYKTPNVVIYGYIGTSAEKYAKSNQIPFVNLDNSTSIENKTWQQLYADELKRYMTSDEYKTDSMFDLYDVNNDDIPELFISTGTSHADGCFVYTVLNGQLKELEKHDDWTCGEYGLINCSSSIQTIFSSWSQLGHYYIDYYQIQNDKFVHLLKAYTDVADVGLENATYKINDETVIVKKYNEEISKYEADDYVKIGRKYTLDEKTINSVLLNEQETTEDLIIETVKLTNDDIKPEWEHVTSLNLEYPVFKSKDTELQDFLTNSVTEKILGYMETNSDYPCISIYGNFEYDMSVNGYLSISAYISNRPSDSGTGTYTIPYTFFVDLQNKKILSLNDLFLETEDTIYKEVAIKAAKYNKSHAQHDTLLNYNYKECKFILTKDNLILTFNPYSISSGADGIINIEIPLTDLDLTCIIS